MDQRLPNPEKNYTKISILIAVIAAVFIFLPSWAGIDGMDGGFAISFTAVWITLSAAVVAWMFGRRAARLERLLQGMEVLAHWKYTPAEWRAFTGDDRSAQTQTNRNLWLLMSGLSLLIGLLFWLFDREAGLIVLLVMIGLIIFLALPAFGLPQLRYHRQRNNPGEAWLSPTAIYFDGVFTPWGGFANRLEDVAWQDATAETPACLCFQLVHVVAAGTRHQTLRVPVPFDRIDEGRALLERFKVG